VSAQDDFEQAIFAPEICRAWDCDEFAQVLVDVDLVWMDDQGVEHLGKQIVAMCRRHANAERAGPT
jgi:hypothetical protein